MPTFASERLSPCQLRKFGYDTLFMCQPRFAFASPIATNAPGSRYGNGRSSIARMQLKIVALTPMPSAKQSTAVTVNAGLLTSVRNANRMSWSMSQWKGTLAQTVGPRLWLNWTSLSVSSILAR